MNGSAVDKNNQSRISGENRTGQHPPSCPVLGKRGPRTILRTGRTFLPLQQKITFGKTRLRTCVVPETFLFLLLPLVKQHCLVCVSNGRMMEANCSEFSFRSWTRLKFGRVENKTRLITTQSSPQSIPQKRRKNIK